MHQDTWSTPDNNFRRRAIIVTWNPDKTPWVDEYLQFVEQTAHGVCVKSDWSTGNRTGGVSTGDRVFMLRQGAQGRGIIASGSVLKGIYPEAHWDRPGETANFVDVIWECVVPVADRLSTDVLHRELPEQHWRPQNSGILVKADLVAKLEVLWSNHLTRIGRREGSGQSQGQDRLADAQRRKKIEDAAQNRLMEHYRTKGWTVVDTRFGNPFDATAEKDDLVCDPWVVAGCGTAVPPAPDFLYLEAKGTQSGGSSVLVTRGEVNHARANKGRCVMGIWAEIEFGDDGEVDAMSGTFDIIPFLPYDEDLSAVTYEWRPPNQTTSTKG